MQEHRIEIVVSKTVDGFSHFRNRFIAPAGHRSCRAVTDLIYNDAGMDQIFECDECYETFLVSAPRDFVDA